MNLKYIFLSITLLFSWFNTYSQEIKIDPDLSILNHFSKEEQQVFESVFLKYQGNLRYHQDENLSQKTAFLSMMENEHLPLETFQELGISVLMEVSERCYVIKGSPVSLEIAATLPEVKYIETAKTLHALNNRTKFLTRTDLIQKEESSGISLKGKGVFVGIIDRGFDFKHVAFTDEEGTSRIKCIIIPASFIQDQFPYLYDSFVPYLDENGVLFVIDNPDAIALLKTDNDELSHGTHVTGTAVANNDEVYGGMAPEAEIILAVCPNVEENNTTLAMLVKQMVFYAQQQDQPIAINISLGENKGPHDGTDAIPAILSDLLEDGTRPGVICAIAAGNEGSVPLGLETNMPSDGIKTFLSPQEIDDENGLYLFSLLEVWSGDSTPIDFRYFLFDKNLGQEIVSSPTFSYSEYKESGFSSQSSYMKYKWEESGIPSNIFVSSGVVVSVSWGIANNNHRYFIKFNCTGVIGQDIVLGFELIGPTDLDTRLYASGMTYNPTIEDYQIPGFTGGTLSASYNSYACTDAVISVGAYVSSWRITNIEGHTYYADFGGEGQITDFSSWGQSFNGVNIPSVIAPGTFVVSPTNYYQAYNAKTGKYDVYTVKTTPDDIDNSHQNTWGFMSGTSMAAPAVTGIIADWLQLYPRLTTQQVKEIIQSVSEKQPIDGETSTYRIDALAGAQFIINHYCGIKNIHADEHNLPELLQSSSIYSIDGRCISNTIHACEILPLLPTGLYVVNGNLIIK